ncbi:MAG TPA: DUF2339 domain-containing protein [Bryobacteraceae bacterium]|nr:DUF2339 domain-containing protein [Bryobacteraceae bacterium]
MQDDTESRNNSPKRLPDDEAVRQLAAEVKMLSSQIAELENKVARLEGRPIATPGIETLPIVRPATVAAVASGTTGLKLLNRAGAVTLFLGIIFFFKYAVDNQWIGAAGRVLLGVVAGLALLGAGEWLRTRGQSIFAQGVSACGILTLYISAFAASDYYKLIDSAAAFVAMVIIAISALVLSVRHSDTVLAVVGYLSALMAPALWHGMDQKFWAPNVWAWFGFVYLFAVQVGTFRQSARQKKRILIPIVAAAVAVEAFYLINPGHPIVCVLFFLGLAALHFRSGLVDGYVLGHLFVLLAGTRFLFFWLEQEGPAEVWSSLFNEAESIFLGVYGIALLIAAVTRKSASDRVFGLALLGVVIGKLYIVDVWLLTRFYRISAFVALGVLLLASSFVYSRWRQRTNT